MLIQRIKLKNYRNYEDISLEFSKNMNIIYGENAQGKTNIIESIFLCATGRSHRTSKDVELIKFGNNRYTIHLDLIKNQGETSINIDYEKNSLRKIEVNEIKIKKIGNLMGILNVVMFSPEDLMIIKEGPSERRRFIDITISQLKPSYFYDLQQYNKVLIQKNNLLKELQTNKKLLDTLEVWNKELIDIGLRIIKTRHKFIERLNILVRQNHSRLTDNSEVLEIKYQPFFAGDYTETFISNTETSSFSNIYENIEEIFLKKVEDNKWKEIARGSSLYGPQRDDYTMLLNGKNIKLYGSQGQQRTSILSLKLSEIDIINEDIGEYPVLLLDDVMSELDQKRQQHLYSAINDIQTFITCTDKNLFDKNNQLKIKHFNIVAGKEV